MKTTSPGQALKTTGVRMHRGYLDTQKGDDAKRHRTMALCTPRREVRLKPSSQSSEETMPPLADTTTYLIADFWSPELTENK